MKKLRADERLAARSEASVWIVFCLLLLVGCGGGGSPEEEDLPYIPVDKSLQPLRSEFEDSYGSVRLVAVVAPTCGSCRAVVEDILHELLTDVRDEDFEVFVVWTSILVTDVEPRARRESNRYAHPRIRHYWDEEGRVARAFSRMLGLRDETNAYDCYFLYGRTDTWDPEGLMDEEPPGQNVLLAGWEPEPPQVSMTQHKTIQLPEFKWANMAVRVREQLALRGAAP